MKATIIKIGLIIGVVLFLGSATSWAEGRKYNHHDDKHGYKEKAFKSNHHRYGRTPHHNGHGQRHYYAKRPGHFVGRHHKKHHRHDYYRPFPRYHHRHHSRIYYPFRHGIWMFW